MWVNGRYYLIQVSILHPIVDYVSMEPDQAIFTFPGSKDFSVTRGDMVHRFVQYSLRFLHTYTPSHRTKRVIVISITIIITVWHLRASLGV
jgi:hypothetical protein